GAPVTSYSNVDPKDIGIAALEAATKAGVVVTVSAGNDGPGAGTIADLASAPDVITAGAIVNDRGLGYAVQVSGANPYQALPGTGPAPSQPVSGTLVDAATVDPTGQACSPLPASAVSGKVVLIQRGSCTFENKVNDAAAGGALAAIIYNNAGASLISMSVGSATLPAVFIGQPDGTDLQSRLAANPGLQVTLDFSGISAFAIRTDLVSFSSRGPSIGSAMKPDLLAVGAELITAAQNTYSDGESYDPSGYINTAGTSFSAPLTAGAAAILKAARPGLTVAQYRSLLINNAGPATTGPGVSATVQQAGGGVLNVAAALGGTVTAYPTSLNFGLGAGSISQNLNLSLSNVGTSSDTYSIAVVPSGNSPAPAPSASTLRLDANGSQQIALTLNASGLAEGEYQGYVQVTGTASQNVIQIPYWFAVPGSTPAAISVLYSDASDSPASTARAAVLFRVVDVAGLPFSGSVTPKVVISTGGGTVRNTYRAGSVPGTYAVDIRTGTGTMQVDITVGSLTQSVVIPVF
ncbi:MAG TPA: S8 family serine peptidase, partial [Bryobacteraceae bacterium]